MENTIYKLNRLNDLGVTIAMDDFGTGYSSLGYLNKLPIHTLKIAQYFMRGIPDNPDDTSLVTTIIAMAKSLKLKLIAEGVETEEQLDFLRQQGCEEFQGYFFSQPVPARAFTKLLKQNKRFWR